MFGGAALAGAQTFPQVAPNQPPKSPPAQVAPALVKKIGRETSGNAVVASRLAGLRFVSSAREVQANGFKGVQAIDPGDVKFAAQPDFAPVVQPFLGQPVTLVSLDKLTSAVVAYYRRHDRPIVNVFAPQQNITNGYVQIVVAEGHVGDVTAKGATWFSNDDLRSDLRLRAGDPISGQVLRDDLDWMNRNPFHQSDVVFGPGDSPGLTDITLKTADRFPVRFFAGYDDAGNQFTGDYRYFTGFNYGDLFGLGQQISYQFSTAEDTNEFTAHSGSWIIPLPWRHILTIYGDYGQSSANVPGTAGLFHSSGVSWQTSLRYEVPLRAPTNMTHSLIAGFDFKESNNNLAFGGVPVALGAETADTAQFVVGYQAAYTDPYGSTSGSIMAFLSPGDLTSADSTAAYQSQRFAAKPAYEYGQLTLQRTTTLPWDFTWTERGQLQISDQNLLPSEQIGLGGYDTVRGYDEREATGDSGFYVSSELATPPISLGNLVGLAQATDRCQFLGFVDYGGTTLHNPGPADTNPNTNLLGIGPGVRYDITPYVSFRFDYGFQLIKTGFDSRYDSRGHIGLVMSLPGGPDERASTPPASGRPGMPAAIPGFLEQVDTNQAGTGANVNVYGGLTAFQNSTATLDSDAPISPNSLSADQQSEVGGVGGLHAGYTWKDFTDTLPLFMPALDGDFFWAGYKYKTEATTPAFSGSFLSSNANTYSLLVEPKMKFNLGSFRPYVGGGFGGTFIQADGSNTNLVNALGHISESSSKSLDAGCFSVEGLAGLEYFFDPHWAMTFEYKYLYMDEQGSVHSSLSVGGTKVHLMYNLDGLGTNLFTGGLSYYF
jgi:hemolysin activation/secretion protein